MANTLRWTPEQLTAFQQKKAAVAIYRGEIAANEATKKAERHVDPAINDRLSESAIQRAFIDWCNAAEGTDWRLRLLFAVPNGGKRAIKTAITLQAEGLRKGVCDVMLPFPNGGHAGLAIEFKSKRGVLSDDQKIYIADLVRGGWRVEVCRSSLAAIAIVKDYLGMAA